MRPSKQADGKYQLSLTERATVVDVVRDCRGAARHEISPAMRLIADENAQEILSDEYGLDVSLARLDRVA